MPQPKSRAAETVASRSGHASRGEVDGRPFFGALEPVLVDDRGDFVFDGAIARIDARSIWTWLARDVAPDLIDPAAPDGTPSTLAVLEANTPVLLSRARAAMSAVAGNADAERRLKGQLGGGGAWVRLPAILTALKCAPLLGKAQAFGRVVNSITDDEALAAALQSMPRHDPATAALLMMAAVEQVTNTGRLVVAATRIAGEASESALVRAGLAPVIDACLARAQNAIPPLLQAGAFADVDLICRSIERFHRLVRGVSANVELPRLGRWAMIVAGLTKTISGLLEPRLRDITPDINRAMRRARDGADRLDADALLAATGGMFLLATVRDCRDSLALNEMFDETWALTGQALEIHVNRNLDALRDTPGDAIVAARVDAGIRMAEARFGSDHADVLRRARGGLERRPTSG